MDTAAVLRDLARAKAAFQLRTIEAIITERPMNDESRAPNQESAALPVVNCKIKPNL
ncbi:MULTISPECIES: hypothetical protein [unclassified Sulfitobacter]|uniref:hypothetical protein n=1 Tax=Sulfitobacter phage pCB2047-C TaxID=754043 RepID=UPI0002C04537|nr:MULTISPECIES: hypothetical protein [unclassified Sulfitobacter]YP_007675278.1 hypothetical protein SUBG_00021 [Sulfitobacter phage pCB2047-C]YP_007675452.1 hypothetical protein SUAG_00060 [Sulfitobacter phage pCB2047-A]YP_009146182.1 hypothetical protein SUFP_008 [Sulfitobacter phage NYA-2014a]AGG91191.1 hypothetical protein SUBG_00021 [Sulfitobacter phage pCB2047-C]AGH30786.1 hypothetical protein SUAG_00060 [Sulfitobacter phage pCB2047-A]AIM40639.1 hypothetical protein SUFP_008 [Sulfitoba